MELYFNIWVISKAVNLSCCLYFIYVVCFPALWCSSKMLPVRFENDLAKRDFTHVTTTLLRWKEDHNLLQGTQTGSCWAILGFLTALHSHLQCQILCCGSGAFAGCSWCLLLSRGEGMNCSSMSSQELKLCCQEPHADLGWTGTWWCPFSAGPVVAQPLCVGTGGGRAVGTVGWAASPPAGTGAGYRVGTHLQEQGLALLCFCS